MKNKKLLFLSIGLLILLCIGITSREFQNDTFYTIKIGQLIMNNGIDMLDHFSWHNLPYTYPHWLYDVFIYFIYSFSGFTGLYISSIVLFSILILSIYFVNYKISKNTVLSFFMAIICTIVLSSFATARAQLVSYILFIWQIYFIESLLIKMDKKYVIGLLLISLLLCNIHVAVWPFYFILFLPFIAEYLLAILLKKFNKNKISKFINNKFDLKLNKNTKYLILIMIASCLTGFFTPIGDTPYTYLYNTYLGNSQNYILEHAANPLYKSPFVLIIVIETIVMLFLSKLKVRDIIMIAGLTVMSIMSSRHVSLFVLVGGVYFIRSFSDYLNKIDFNFDFILKNKKIIIITSILLVIISGILFYNNSKQKYINDELYPVKATKYIKENLNVKKIRLFNEYTFGSYLLYKDIPVFIDSRADLYTKPFNKLDYDIFDDYYFIINNYEEKFKFYKITHILTYNTTPLNSNLSINNNYKLIYKDKYFNLYERKN